MSDCENRHPSSPSRHSREGGNPQVFTAKYAKERRVKTLTTEAQRHKELPGGWVETTFAEVVEILDSRRVPVNAKERAARLGDFPYYGANGQAGTIDDFLFDGDYVLIAEDGGNFNDILKSVSYSVSGKFWVNNHAHIVGTLSGMSSKFIEHATNAMDWMPYVSGTTRLKLNQGKMKEALFNLPPLNEQKRIVAKIEALQARSKAAREALAEVPKLVEQFKQSVLAAAFRGDLTKTWREQHPDVEPAEQLLARIRTERRAKWETDQLVAYDAKGKTPPKNWQSRYKEPASFTIDNVLEIPESWCQTSLSQLFSVSSGDGLTAKNMDANGTIPVYGGNGINGYHCKSNVSECTLCIGRVGFYCGAVHLTKQEAWITDNALIVTFPSNCINQQFMYWLLTATNLRASDSSTAQPVISGQKIYPISVTLVPLDEQHQITQRIESLFAYVDSILEQVKASLEELNRLDQSILAKAFRGELVPQDPSDEPASVLLERIKVERAKAAPIKRSRKKATV